MTSRLEPPDPFDPQIRADPYPAYDQLRAADPVHFSHKHCVWFLTRYADVVGLLRDERTSVATAGGGDRSLLGLDRPEHARLRPIAARAFSPRFIERLRPFVVRTIDQLLDRARPRQRFDVVGDVAYPLTIDVIGELIGVPVADKARFRQWATVLSTSVDLDRSPRIGAAIAAADTALRSHVTGVVGLRRRSPADDFVTLLLHAADDSGTDLETEEVVGLCRLLLLAGHDTSVNLIGNGVHALLAREKLDELRRDPAVVTSAVEELLRYDSPVQITGRTTLEPLALGGTRIPRGDIVLALLGAANRDPEAFRDPNELDLARSPNRHVAFGRGIHACLGAGLARLEAEVLLEALTSDFPAFELGSNCRRRTGMSLRGFAALELVRVGRSRRSAARCSAGR